MSKYSSHASRVFLLCLAGGAATTGYYSLTWGLADRPAFQAQRIINGAERGEVVTLDSFDQAIALAREALVLNPSHPAYLDQLASYLLVKLELEFNQQTAEEAKRLLLASREIRPESPTNWAHFITLKHLMAEPDRELSEAISTGIHVGPWEPKIIETVAEAGIASFSSFDPATRLKILDMIKRGLDSPSGGVPEKVAAAIRKHPSSWTLELIQALLDHLVLETWTGPYANHRARSDVAVMFWKVASHHQRRELAQKLARTILLPLGLPLLDTLSTEQKRLVCLYLPRRSPYLQGCST